MTHMEIPRSEWIKLGVFLHPKMHEKVQKLADADGLSMTKFVEKLVEQRVSPTREAAIAELAGLVDGRKARRA